MITFKDEPMTVTKWACIALFIIALIALFVIAPDEEQIQIVNEHVAEIPIDNLK